MPRRPGQWDLLDRDHDPVEADVAAVDSRLAHYRELADMMETEGLRLQQIADRHALAGEYADRLRETAGEVASDLRTVVGRYHAAIDAITGYVPALETALAGSASALDDAVSASQALGRADAIPTQRASAGETLTPDQEAANDAKDRAHDAAADDLRAAKARLNQVLSVLDEAGQRAAGTIRGGFGDGLTDSSMDRFTYRFMQFLKVLVKVLTYIGIALAALALVIPGVGALVLAAGVAIAAVVVVAETVLAATGNGSWADVGIAIAGLLTFGLGKVLAPALKALGPTMASVRGSMAGVASQAERAFGGVTGRLGALGRGAKGAETPYGNSAKFGFGHLNPFNPRTANAAMRAQADDPGAILGKSNSGRSIAAHADDVVVEPLVDRSGRTIGVAFPTSPRDVAKNARWREADANLATGDNIGGTEEITGRFFHSLPDRVGVERAGGTAFAPGRQPAPWSQDPTFVVAHATPSNFQVPLTNGKILNLEGDQFGRVLGNLRAFREASAGRGDIVLISCDVAKIPGGSGDKLATMLRTLDQQEAAGAATGKKVFGADGYVYTPMERDIGGVLSPANSELLSVGVLRGDFRALGQPAAGAPTP